MHVESTVFSVLLLQFAEGRSRDLQVSLNILHYCLIDNYKATMQEECPKEYLSKVKI